MHCPPNRTDSSGENPEIRCDIRHNMRDVDDVGRGRFSNFPRCPRSSRAAGPRPDCGAEQRFAGRRPSPTKRPPPPVTATAAAIRHHSGEHRAPCPRDRFAFVTVFFLVRVRPIVSDVSSYWFRNWPCT